MINEIYAQQYCKDDISKIENYEEAIADTTQTWHCHHRTEIWWNCSKKELIEQECYYNRKACELIFLTPNEHKRIHRIGNKSPHLGHHHSVETRRKIAEGLKGKTRKPLSDEHRRHMSEAIKAYWAERKASL